MNVMTWRRGLLALLVAGSVGLAGCSDGGSSHSSAPATKSVSGTVADGYLEGATVFSDQNGNKVWDEGEPKTVTGEHGAYTLEGSDLDQYPLVVEVTTETVDEDTGAKVAKPYLLAAPAGHFEWVSPVTTLIQHQLEQAPALTVEQAEALIQDQLGVSVGLFEDYVADGSGENAVVHALAQAVATSFGNFMEMADATGSDASVAATITVVMDTVIDTLDDFVTAAHDDLESFDPVAAAEEAATALEAEFTEGFELAVIAAETPVVFDSWAEALQGLYWIDVDVSDGGESLWVDGEYGAVSLGADGRLDEVENQWNQFQDRYDVEAIDYEPNLMADGSWVECADQASEYQVTINADGTTSWIYECTGDKETGYLTSQDVSGLPMAAYAKDAGDFLIDPEATFPAGSKVYSLTFEAVTDSFELWSHNGLLDEVGEGITTLSEVPTYFTGEGPHLYFEYDTGLHFNADGSVTIERRVGQDPDTFEAIYETLGTGTWEQKTLRNTEMLVVSMSKNLMIETDLDGPLILVEYDGMVVKGEWYQAGVIELEDDIELNAVAGEAFLANLELPYTSPVAITAADLEVGQFAANFYGAPMPVANLTFQGGLVSGDLVGSYAIEADNAVVITLDSPDAVSGVKTVELYPGYVAGGGGYVSGNSWAYNAQGEVVYQDMWFDLSQPF